MLKAVMFDVFGTLISTGTGSVDATRAILQKRGSSLEPAAFYAQWKAMHGKRTREAVFAPERELYTRDLEELYRLHGISGDPAEDVELLLASQYHRSAFPEAQSCLRYLRRFYRILLTSNTDTAPLMQNLEDNGIAADGVYTSEGLQCYKPAPAFYQTVCQREELLPEECIFIGDSLVEDVEGPKGVGMQAILLDRNGTYRPRPGQVEPDRILGQLPTEGMLA